MMERLNPDAAVAFVTQLQAKPLAASITPALAGPSMQSTALVVADSILPAVVTPRVLTPGDVLRDFDRYVAWTNATAITVRAAKGDDLYRAIINAREVAPFEAPLPASSSDTVKNVLSAIAKHPLGAQTVLTNVATTIAEAYNATAPVEATHDAAAGMPSRGWFGNMFVGGATKSSEKSVAAAFTTARDACVSKVTAASYAVNAFEQFLNAYLTTTQVLPSVILRTRMAERTQLIQQVQQRVNELGVIKTQLTQEAAAVVQYATQGNATPAHNLISRRQSYLVRFEAIDLQLGASMDALAEHAGGESLSALMPEFGPLKNTERLSDPGDLKGAHGWCIEGCSICERSIKALNDVLADLNASQARDTADSQRISTVERQVVRAAALADT